MLRNRVLSFIWKLEMLFSKPWRDWRKFNRMLKPWSGRTQNIINALK
jgi:hypothetical protein